MKILGNISDFLQFELLSQDWDWCILNLRGNLINTPDREQLIAYNRSLEEIRQIIGADSLDYLRVERLQQLSKGLPICMRCFTGKYPMDPPTEDIRGEYER